MTASPKLTIEKTKTLHRGLKKRREGRERLRKRHSFVDSELSKLEEIATAKREAKKKEQLEKGVGSALAILPDLLKTLPGEDDEIEKKDSSDRAPEGRRGGLKHAAFGRTVKEEVEQMQRVRKNEVFVDKGIEALRAHLSNTVCNDAAKIPDALPGHEAKRPKVQRVGGVLKPGKSASGGHTGQQSANDRSWNRRQAKKLMAEEAEHLAAKNRAEVKPQTFQSLLSGGRRGRIGEKRAKVL